MKQQEKEKKQRRETLHRLCSASGLLLSVVCCIGLIHVELKIQEHHRLISHSVTFCDKMKTEILRKLQQNYERWQVVDTSRDWQATKGMFCFVYEYYDSIISCVICQLFWGAFSGSTQEGAFRGFFFSSKQLRSEEANGTMHETQLNESGKLYR